MDLEQFIQARQNGTRRPRSPSQRTPESSRHLNTADIIEERMQNDGHRSWGFVIYRTTYASDQDWGRCLSRIHAATQECFEFYNGRDVLDLRKSTVMDNVRIFDGMDSHAVRKHFRQWVADHLVEEQGPQSQTTSHLSPRYRFAIQIDAEALESIVNQPDLTDLMLPADQRGWLKLIDAEWYAGRWSTDEAYEAIEGTTEEDVGWMKQPWSDVHGDLYTGCYDRNFWPAFYVRPPALP
ncbi:hypothetical protein V2A60_005001 [Cordyceps javanica]